MADKIKIGFIVEGDTDRIIVEVIAGRILHGSHAFKTVRIGGTAALMSIHTTVSLFLLAQFSSVLVVFDANGFDPDTIKARADMVLEYLHHHGFFDQVRVCPAVPEIEAWLLAGRVERPEEVVNARARLASAMGRKALGPDDVRYLAETLDIDLACLRSDSFNKFVTAIREIAAGANGLVTPGAKASIGSRE